MSGEQASEVPHSAGKKGEFTHSRRRPVRLCECVEDQVQLVLRDPDARVRHAEFKRHARVVQREQAAAERDVALLRHLGRRKLDRVADQVRDDLPQAERVADELVRDVRVDVIGEIEIVLRGAHDERLEDTEDRLPERE